MAGIVRFAAVDLTYLAATYGSSQLTWTEVNTANTSVVLQTALDGESFTTVANGGAIAGLSAGNALSGVRVTIRVQLITTNVNETPVFSGLTMKVVGQQAGLAQATGYYDLGHVKWTSGLNVGKAMEVKSWNATTRTLVLYLSMAFDIAVGDTLEVYPGCDKTIQVCQSKFSNAINFRGEPNVPGNDQLLKAPDDTIAAVADQTL